jgi:hypothetical protein
VAVQGADAKMRGEGEMQRYLRLRLSRGSQSLTVLSFEPVAISDLKGCHSAHLTSLRCSLSE